MEQAHEQTSTRTGDRDRDAIVQCRGLTKIFTDFWMRGRVRAVDAIDLNVYRGEIFGLLGPNGSGKSTTIKMALGLLKPTRGTVSVFDRPPEDVATHRKIGYLPEESYLYRFLDARETLDYYGRLFHQNRTQRRQRIDMLLDMVGLTAVQRRPVGEYSKGMQRRIGLAQALINDPDLLILDEPTTGLDPIGTRQVKDLINELARRGKTVILCSHLLADVEDVCNRIAIMFGGKVHKDGPVDTLLTRAGNTTIQTSDLDAETIQKVEKVLEDSGRHIESIDRPRQRLESLFLDIVHEALASGKDTSGARSDGKLADFLVTDASSDEAETGAVIEDLMHGGPPVETKSNAPEVGQPNASTIDDLLTNEPATPNELVPDVDAAGQEPAMPETRPDEAIIEGLMGEDRREQAKGESKRER